MFYAPLPNRTVLIASGADTEHFLQGLISNDIRKLSSKGIIYAALLTPQGKFLHDFFLIRSEENILIDVDASRADDLLRRFSQYKLRAQVTITQTPEKVTALWSQTELPDLQLNHGFADPRLAAMGYRIIGEYAPTDATRVTFEAYEQHRIALGIPDGAQDALIDKSFLLELGFESLHGVDFNKGCYVGQEVTARSKFRGQVRKQLYQVRSESELPPLGTKILQDGMEVGELRSHAGNIGLAIVRIEAVEKASQLTANGSVVFASLPGWASPVSG